MHTSIPTAFYCNVDSPIGPLLLLGNGRALTALYMQAQNFQAGAEATARRDPGAFKSAREQLAAYFAGELDRFSLELDASGTAFQKRVWRALCDIPYGHTESYGALARRIGADGAARAVGLANSRNPLGIIVPCHRVIGAKGALTGYAGGLECKRWLLAHESRHAVFELAPDIARAEHTPGDAGGNTCSGADSRVREGGACLL